MNTYEILVILKPILDVDNSDNALAALEGSITNLKGEILRKDKLGRKRLAYEIDKFKDGFMTSFIVKLDPKAIEEFQRLCSLNEDVLRIMVIREGKVDLLAFQETSAAQREERRDERPRFGGPRGDREGGFRRDRNDRDRDRGGEQREARAPH